MVVTTSGWASWWTRLVGVTHPTRLPLGTCDTSSNSPYSPARRCVTRDFAENCDEAGAWTEQTAQSLAPYGDRHIEGMLVPFLTFHLPFLPTWQCDFGVPIQNCRYPAHPLKIVRDYNIHMNALEYRQTFINNVYKSFHEIREIE